MPIGMSIVVGSLPPPQGFDRKLSPPSFLLHAFAFVSDFLWWQVVTLPWCSSVRALWLSKAEMKWSSHLPKA